MGTSIWFAAAYLALFFHHVRMEFQLVQGKHNFMKAMHACSDIGEEWQLPDDQTMGNDLAKAMGRNKIQSVWLSIFRRTFIKWQWVDGIPDATFETNTKHKYCAMLTLTGEIIPTTCISQGVGLVCQIPAARPCPDHHSCLRMNNTKFFVDCTLTDWYGARSICLNYGGDLVILNEKWKVKLVEDHLAKMDNSIHCQKVFVGLHRENWLAVDPEDEGRVLFTTKWGLGEPSPLQHRRCSVAVKNSMRLESWAAKSCLETNNVLCFKENDKIEVSTKDAFSVKTKPTASTILKATDSPRKSVRNVPIVQISIGVIGSTIIIILLIVVTYYVVRRRRGKRTLAQLKIPQPASDAVPLLPKFQNGYVNVLLVVDKQWMKSDEHWKVTPLSKDGHDCIVDISYRDYPFMDLFIHSLELSNAKRKDFNIFYAGIDTNEDGANWQQCSKLLQNVKGQNYDVLLISAGLEHPPENSPFQSIVCDLIRNSVVISGPVSAKASKVSADLPIQNVISVRNGYEDLDPRNWNFDVPRQEKLDSICSDSWAGAVRITALVARIICLLRKSSEELPEDMILKARTTEGMREILSTTCARGFSRDQIPIIKPEMFLAEDFIDRVKNVWKNNSARAVIINRMSKNTAKLYET